MRSISDIVSILSQACEMVEESLCENVWTGMAVINSMVIYFRNNPVFAVKYQSHKLYREELIHQLV